MRRVIQYLAAALCICAAYGCSRGSVPLPPVLPSSDSAGLIAPASVAFAVPASWSRMDSTAGRIGLIQSFDYSGPGASETWITTDGHRYSAVWASVYPRAWDSAHAGMMVSDYFILGLDRKPITYHDITWFQANHPTWVLYGCNSSTNAPTHDVAYMRGINDGEVPLDIHNPAVVQFQINTMDNDAKARGYNTLAVDQVVFWNTYGKTGEYGCGTWSGSTFVRRYASANDVQFAHDVANYVKTARPIAHAAGVSFAVNHPAGSLSNADELTVIANVDLEMDETGFSDYGHYASNPSNFGQTLSYLKYAQHQGTPVATLNRFTGVTTITPQQMEFVTAGYLLANEGTELIFTGVDHQYNYEQYHSEYATAIGTPCADTTGGPVYVRRFTKGMVVANGSSLGTTVALPATGFKDIEGRSVTYPLKLGPSDAYVLLGPGGC